MKSKYIETAEKLYQLWREYKTWTKENPYKKNDFKSTKEGVVEVFLIQERPATIAGFEGWLSENAIIANLNHYMANTDEAYNEYKEVIERIKAENKSGLLSGALAHVYNPNLTGAYLRIPKVVEQKNINEAPGNVDDLKPEHLEQLKNIIDEKFNQ